MEFSPYKHNRSYISNITIGGQICLLLLVGYVYQVLPDIIPTHFGFSGAPDRWGSKSQVLLYPVISLCLHFLFVWLAAHPERLNYPVTITPQNREKNYHASISLLYYLLLAIIFIFIFIVWSVYSTAMNQGTGANRWIILAILAGALFSGFIIVNKIKKNG